MYNISPNILIKPENNSFLPVVNSKLTITELLTGGDQHGPAKNSGNSSVPPSSDMVPGTKSLHKPGGKKNRGQTGHEGSTLKFSASTDITQDIVPEVCIACGADLSDHYNYKGH